MTFEYSGIGLSPLAVLALEAGRNLKGQENSIYKAQPTLGTLRASLEHKTLPRPRSELWGESIREIGILLLVFAPLDTFVQYGMHINRRESVALAAVLIGGALGVWLGVWLESK
jgi:hypothetical protein